MKIYALYSSKGGVGKTTSCVNLAWTAASEGRKTLLWDLDPQAAASFFFRSDRGLEASTRKLVSGKSEWKDEIRPTGHPNLFLIPGDGSFRHWDFFLEEAKKSKKVLQDWLKPIKGDFDVLFLDCPPGLSLLSENIFRAATEILVPLVPAPLSLRTLEQLKSFLTREELDDVKLHVFLSMTDYRKKIHKQVAEALLDDPHAFRTHVPQISEIERMGADLRPSASVVKSRSREIYAALWKEIVSAG